jgi:hypothetical protein
VQKITIGDKVIFDADKLESFLEETTSENKELAQYQQHVLAYIDHAGIVKEEGHPFTIVSFPDGQDLKIPTKYLVLSPPM